MSPTEIDERIEVIQRRNAYETETNAFLKTWRAADTRLRKKILSARGALAEIETHKAVLRDCATLCVALGSDGLRGELTLLKAARALAAFEGASAVDRSHLVRVAPPALRHRLRRDPLDEAGSTTRVARAIEEVFS